MDYLPETPKELSNVAADRARHLVSAQRAVQAEKEGYDAFCPFGTRDYGIADGRKLVKTMPVVGQADSCLLYCGLLGRPFGSVIYMPEMEDWYRECAAEAGLAGQMVHTTSIGFPNKQYPERRAELLARFVTCAREAKAKGAELMGLVAMSICPVEYSAKELSGACGIPVLDALACQVAMAEWWHRTGLPPTLLRYPRG